MAKSISTFLRRATRYPGGIATGGGETGLYPQPQHHLWTVALWGPAGTFKDILVPKGALLTSYVVFPFNANDTILDGVAATGGTVTIDKWSNVSPPADPSGGTSSAVLLAATAANAYSLTSIGSPAIYTVDTRIRFRVATAITPYTAGANGNGAVLVGFYGFMPRIRP